MRFRESMRRWLKSISKTNPSPAMSNRQKKAYRRRLAAERLEDRSLFAVFTVVNELATGLGSLADAISRANATPVIDTIQFRTAGSTIELAPTETASPTPWKEM